MVALDKSFTEEKMKKHIQAGDVMELRRTLLDFDDMLIHVYFSRSYVANILAYILPFVSFILFLITMSYNSTLSVILFVTLFIFGIISKLLFKFYNLKVDRIQRFQFFSHVDDPYEFEEFMKNLFNC